MKMRASSKIFAMAVIGALVLSVLAPVFIAKASTGHPKLGAVDNRTAPNLLTMANYNVSLPAGSDAVSKIDNVSASGYFAIVFYDGAPLVTFSGSQFDLYISKDGYSQISADDKVYAAGFYVADLDSTTMVKVTKTNALLKNGKGDFYLGSFDTYKVLVGPIPFDITPDYKFIKIYDGVVTSVAVSAQVVDILPSLELTPTSGPAGRTVTLKGVALKSNAVLNLTYSATNSSDIFAQVSTDEYGKFTHSWAIKDLKSIFTGTNTTILSDPVVVYVWYNATGALIGSLTYTEYRRAFVQLKSVKYGDVAQNFISATQGSGNYTLTVNVYVNDNVVVAGNWWNPTSDVSFTVGTTSLGTVTPNATGFFNITLTVPELASGSHVVKVSNAGVTYVFTMVVHPTLLVTPEEGPIGTVVSCLAYGFPANTKVYLWWYEKAYGDGTWYNVVNGTTGSDGKFNVTVQFTVFHTYGGEHDVKATDVFSSDATALGIATFKVTPLLSIVPSVIKNDGSEVKAVGTGFDPTIFYVVNMDNTQLGATVIYAWSGGVRANDTGDITITFIAAGFRPGLHVLSLYPEAYEAPYSPAIYALFNVTAEGDYIGDILLGINGTVVAINGTVATISTTLGTITTSLSSINATVVAIQSGMATISTTLGTITTSLSSISAKIDSVSGTVATISTSIGTVTSTLSSINAKVTEISGDTATIKTDLGTLSGKVTSIDGNVATIKTDVGTVKMDISDLKTDVTGTKDAVSGITLPVWIAVILSLIAAIASIYAVVSIRRKIAG